MKKILHLAFYNKRGIALLACLLIFTVSCKKYLDAKTDKQLVIPTSLSDAQALIDFYDQMNGFYPSLGNESDDDFYLLPNYFSSLNVNSRNHYTWAQEALDETDWTYMYQVVLNANIAMETVDKLPSATKNSSAGKAVKGEAYFFRANAFYQLAEYYAVPYNKSTAGNLFGIPLRLSSDATPVSTRASLAETWQQIIADFKASASLLPDVNAPLSRPSKVAAYAGLARAYLDMGEYDLSGKYADSALQLHSDLINYNTLDSASLYPFERYNAEVIFTSFTQLTGMHLLTNYRVDTFLYASFDSNDLRRSLFFTSNGPGTVGFRGSYDGTQTIFNGMASDELYLIRAECYARLGDKDNAMDELNKLLITRWATGTFIPYTAATADEALNIILAERQKELILRGSRWFDLRRLNQDTRFAKTLMREENGTIYTLPPNDPRYTFLIPADVIKITGMQQSTR